MSRSTKSRYKKTSMDMKKKGDVWIAKKTAADGSSTTMEVKNVNEKLINIEIAYRALIKQRKLKPGSRFFTYFFDTQKLTTRKSAMQILAISKKNIAGKIFTLYKTESLSPASGQHWKHIYNEDGKTLVSRYGEIVSYLSSQEDIMNEDSSSEDSWLQKLLQKPHYLVIIVVLLIIGIPAFKNFLKAKRGHVE